MLCEDDAAANANARAMPSYVGAVATANAIVPPLHSFIHISMPRYLCCLSYADAALIRQMDSYPCYLGYVDAALMLCSCLAMQC